MVALGVTIDGKKIILGIEQVHGENSKAISQWFDKLLERGLKFEEGLLFIIDGAKGIRKAVEQKFGVYAIIQRCRWHKRENVVAYLNDADKVVFRRRLWDVYNKTTHKESLSALKRIHCDLEKINASAANSLAEGLDETLTMHELGLTVELARSLSTTNCVETSCRSSALIQIKSTAGAIAVRFNAGQRPALWTLNQDYTKSEDANS